jgi:hypothetical protein
MFHDTLLHWNLAFRVLTFTQPGEPWGAGSPEELGS